METITFIIDAEGWRLKLATRQAYAMLKKNYQTKVSESKYMLQILTKMAKKDEIDLEQNCSICFDTMTNPSLTPCGHMFCKECLEMCLHINIVFIRITVCSLRTLLKNLDR